MEDVNAADTTRAEDAKTTKSSNQIITDSPKNNKSRGKLSLSDLLNTLNGVSSQEDRVLIITTNHIKYLNNALIRPNRVDRKILFHLADKNINSRFFYTIFKQLDEDRRTPETRVNDETVKRLANEFTTKIPKQIFNPAKIISFLLKHKQSPTNIIVNVEK